MNRIAVPLNIPKSTWRLSRVLAVHLVALAQKAHKRFSDRRTRRAIGHLTADQLRDIGLDPQPDNRLAVSASLMARLMSMG